MSNEIAQQDRENLARMLAEDLAYCSLEELRHWFRLLQIAKDNVKTRELDG